MNDSIVQENVRLLIDTSYGLDAYITRFEEHNSIKGTYSFQYNPSTGRMQDLQVQRERRGYAEGKIVLKKRGEQTAVVDLTQLLSFPGQAQVSHPEVFFSGDPHNPGLAKTLSDVIDSLEQHQTPINAWNSQSISYEAARVLIASFEIYNTITRANVTRTLRRSRDIPSEEKPGWLGYLFPWLKRNRKRS
ncbi:hypothetical protein J4410_02655 [Candidatus Woesearchaeota archaeon]|nr:hypothetical protein [Candidatus Woesearchaeota archaeon]